jgi:hypothetical protein
MPRKNLDILIKPMSDNDSQSDNELEKKPVKK